MIIMFKASLLEKKICEMVFEQFMPCFARPNTRIIIYILEKYRWDAYELDRLVKKLAPLLQEREAAAKACVGSGPKLRALFASPIVRDIVLKLNAKKSHWEREIVSDARTEHKISEGKLP